jgi:hypothetical protein
MSTMRADDPAAQLLLATAPIGVVGPDERHGWREGR